jgi:hypothetical protein
MIECCATCYDVRSRTCRLFSRQTSTLLVNVEDVFLVCVRRERERYHRAPVSLGLPSAGGVTGYGGRGAVSDEHVAEDGPTVFAHACRLGAEDIVSKKVDGTYWSGPCPVWIKVRNPASIAVQRERSENWNG